ncbi:aspartyl protease family protein [Qipengyuania sphaerica]|uniref:aspartyl protease family protein n=1 Tax=Qipengyuania sphaerica TaxID=2867243 RepID=UPI001C886B19|nr:aspartyl protease family protein [Qipengyuania sphaerica]MBX7540258.1 aspartyl protease family protein [Qipengyuania sphaerica]
MFRARVALFIFAIALSHPLRAENLEVRGDRLFVTAEIGGKQVEALLDSGAEVTILDRAFAEEAGLVGGQTVEARGTGKSTVEARLLENLPIRALGSEFTAGVAAVMDLSDVGSRLVGTRLPAILGRDLFDAGRLFIDIEGGDIEWLDNSTIIPGTRLDLASSAGIETMPVRFGETVGRADFDLGNGSGLLVSANLARKLGREPIGLEPGGGIGGAKLRPVVIVPSLLLAGRAFSNVRAHVDDTMEVDANIGVEQLRTFRIVTDFPGHAIWLEARD